SWSNRRTRATMSAALMPDSPGWDVGMILGPAANGKVVRLGRVRSGPVREALKYCDCPSKSRSRWSKGENLIYQSVNALLVCAPTVTQGPRLLDGWECRTKPFIPS